MWTHGLIIIIVIVTSASVDLDGSSIEQNGINFTSVSWESSNYENSEASNEDENFENSSFFASTTTIEIDHLATDKIGKFVNFDDTTETSEQETTTTELTTETTPIPTCISQLNVTHEIMEETNRIRFYWNFSNDELCEDKTLVIYLTNRNCLTKCMNDESEEICMSNCTKNSYRISVNTKEYTFPYDLTPCSIHFYTIVLSDELENITSEDFEVSRKYKKIQNLKIRDEINVENEKQLDLIIEWDYEYKQCNQSFSVTASSSSKNQQSTTVEYYIKYSNFPACEEFNITVQPDNQQAYAVSKIFSMRKIVPSPINFTVYQDQDKSLIKLNFSEPEFGAKCVKRYIARIENEYENETMDVSMKIISDVYACVNYNITLKASIEDDDDFTSHTTLLTTTSQDYSTYQKTSLHSLNPGSRTSTQQSYQRYDHETFETRSIKTQPRIFNQPQQPRLNGSTENSLTLKVIPGEERKNKCSISKYHIRCVSNENQNNVTNGESVDELVVIERLAPYHIYFCNASIENESSEKSPWSSQANFTTKEGVPNAPVLWKRNDSLTASSFTIEWEKPTIPNGEVIEYKIYIKFQKLTYYIPTYCNNAVEQFFNRSIDAKLDKLEYNFTDAVPAADYLVQIQAWNKDKPGDVSQSSIVTTLEDISDAVENLEIIPNHIELDEPYNKEIKIIFKRPCRANGQLRGFSIEYYTNLNLIQREIVELIEYQEEYIITNDNLDPANSYTIVVSALSTNNFIGRESSINFNLTAGIPFMENNKTLMAGISADISTTAIYITVSDNIFQSDVGKITKIKIIIGQWDCQNLNPRRGLSGDDEKLSVWKEVKEVKCIPVYDPGVQLDHPHPQGYYKEGIGIDSLCENPGLCNGPLRPGTSYGIALRLYTKSGFSDTIYIKVVTKKEVPIVLISIIILSILCLVFLIGFYISCRKTNALINSAIDSPYERKDIAVQSFPSYYASMAHNDNEKIKEEFRAVNSYSENPDKPSIASKANEHLNRYKNIYPFDSTRVVLNDDEYENDYINASYINGYYYPKEYIATQGPKQNTVFDFWRMVIQHRVESIVMLTSLIESNKVKCAEYFPRYQGRLNYANIKIHCIEEQRHANFIKRIFEVEKDDVKLKVKHYYFAVWPDFGCPDNVLDLINFVKTVRSDRQRLGETFIVHCSAGVGRTGTFIALDIMMQRLKKEGKINIFDLVKQLRNQRMKMVQSDDQYQFLYEAAMELISMSKNQNALQNLRLTVLNYINELEFPKVTKLWKWGTKTSSEKVTSNSDGLDQNETTL